ncbi:DUF4442 domain-containing protein [Paraburkholderia sp. UYCP14C]|uniref:DUF4442 domain-containing protein n=1 Tax=Paraburkholderia sp. UYCP14C TaxID=2511130 RepID=UPI00102126D2|nr:DUF4442 domain-containing protein [Paraburkholderia sp. UYCP14C]RZF25418.1 DUF4442 domain-containing protein [Paraburkholderia sp. UYCP14C]
MTITVLKNGPQNQINAVLATLSRLPRALQLPLFNFVFGRFSRFYRTVGVKAASIDPYSVTLTLANRARVRNHIRGIHAVAMTLPAEYAAGLVVAQHLPSNAVVLLRRLQMELHKPIRGSVRAIATLNPEHGETLRTEAEGKIEVLVQIEDETGQAPVSGVMQIAWISRK